MEHSNTFLYGISKRGRKGTENLLDKLMIKEIFKLNENYNLIEPNSSKN